ncbi:plastocyanin/azurin family copper-binding protein [Spirosoma sp.]|uniref:plastocyanin/azurin family copper-binding protein n=1 Tax=Spirosoma sp. TaxID=1899569 RepID=UPI0026298301|nr:plastocyanin/azurin family copper-binding protein [Spirosoma sp.]MCX6214958.1 plastocyanin/azurin family copper-binding protein [Spirosoma sp.]
MLKILFQFSCLLLCISAHAQRDTVIQISATGGLQYSQKRIVVKPNTRLTLVFQNKDDMAHNLVVTRPNSRLRVVEFALALGDKGAQKHYIPAIDDVLAHTTSVEPGNSDSITVKLAEGGYPFVCTFPGHGSIMYGIIYATKDVKRLPAPDQDINIPNPTRMQEAAHRGHHPTVSGHPFPMKLPAVYRTFMPDCGPAAIAVGLPGPNGGQSYVFDAGECRIRYAWSGGFVDNTEQWEGKGQLLTKVVGDIYFRDTGGFPWRVGNAVPKAQFKGYRLVNRYPEFWYVINGVEVHELVKPLPAGRGLIRTFTFSPTKQSLSFINKPQPGIRLQSSLGRFQREILTLPPGTRQVILKMMYDV